MTGSPVGSVSIVICTFNRAPLLRETLAALQAMEPPDDCRCEIIVVDNNSTDDTRTAVAEAARNAARFPVVSLHETRQGKSFALNTALAYANSDVLALADDDVLPSPEWLRRIVADFRTRSVTFVFGKVLPRWERTPPPALLTKQAQDIWGPLALVDYGDEPTDYLPENTGQRLPIGANLAFRRDAIVRIGGWRTDLGKVNNTLISGEDHEIFMRLRRAALYAGYYDPAVTVRHFVPAGRMTAVYFRRWFYWHGKTEALMLDDLYPDLDMATVPRLAGAPRFSWRQGLHQFGRWARSRVSGDALTAFIHELRILQYAGFFTECFRRSRRALPHSAPISSQGPLRTGIVKSR
jgi:glycosyltransferase involved in cell wall biosynthesis